MPATRQLAAILFADIQGYTALMQEDEVMARAIRDKFKRELENEILLHQGRVVQFSGDGALCIFNSAIEAVRAAIGIQKRMQGEPKVPLRIGIHSGDVMFEEENIYGDGVNIASRIESFSVPGSVFISGKVYDEIKNQKDIETVSLGKFELKNVKVPLEIFAINNPGLVIPSKELRGKGIPVPENKISSKKIFIATAIGIALIVFAIFLYPVFIHSPANSSNPKSIAVLPFVNLSALKDDEYFTDGMCDEILTQLLKIGALNVISRTSMLPFRETKKTMREIGEQIGADVLLAGSVQKTNDKVRINVQLIDAKSDKNLWAETYDRDLKDVFAIQTEIAKQIAQSLNTTLSSQEKESFEEKPTDNVEAYDFYLRGNKYSTSFWERHLPTDEPNAIRMYEQAIKLDPKFLEPYDALIRFYIEIYWNKQTIKSDEYFIKAKDWLYKLLALKMDKSIIHLTLAYFKYEGARDYAGALAELDTVDQMLHNDKQTMQTRAYILRRMGRMNEALALFIKRAELYPKDEEAQDEVCINYYKMRDFEHALYYRNKVIKLNPDIADNYVYKAALYSDLRGDLRTPYIILHEAATVVDSNAFKDEYLYLDKLKGNYDVALQKLQIRADSLDQFNTYNVIPNAMIMAIMYNNMGDKVNSDKYFQRSLAIMLHLVEEYPDDYRMYSGLGIAYAGLNEKEIAIEEGMKAVKMMPVTKDALIGAGPLEGLALIYTLLGEQDAAVDILQQLLKMPCGYNLTNTIPLYKNYPYWKPLQNNPRFQKMIQ